MTDYGVDRLDGLPERVTICEVGPRDGLQNEATILPWESLVPLHQVVSVATRVMALGCSELSIGDTIGAATPGRVAALLTAFTGAGVPSNRSPCTSTTPTVKHRPTPSKRCGTASPRSTPTSSTPHH